MSVIVETQNLTKRYHALTAVDRMNLRVQEGEVFGFLGPNGSGKSTTILMLLGLTEPTSGSAKVCGFNPLRDPLQVKRVVSYLPENVGFYSDLSARENMRYTASLNGFSRRLAEGRIGELLGQVGLTEAADRPVGQYSRGMRQRLGIADALLKQPRVVFLDDPTIGLDPEGIRELLDLIVQLSREHGLTVFLSSHLLYQVQRICDRVGIMFRGKMVAEGTVAELGKSSGVRIEVQVDRPNQKLYDALKAVDGVSRLTVESGTIRLDCTKDVRGQVAQVVIGQGLQLFQLQSMERTLEDIYLRYFREAEEAEAAGNEAQEAS